MAHILGSLRNLLNFGVFCECNCQLVSFVLCVFLIWLMIPTEFNGSLLLYNKIIKPYFLKHHKTIDDTVGKVKDTVCWANIEELI
nr:unnamed protein product [Callosobruchus analis]